VKSPRVTSSLLGLLLAVLAGCVAPRSDSSPSAEPVDRWSDGHTDEVRSRLGAGFAKLVEIEAVVVAMPGEGEPEGELVVLLVGGQPAPTDLRLLWTYGGSFVERAETTGKGGFVVERGGHYRLSGYETGRWEGYAHFGEYDEFGPRCARNAGFSHCFRVLDGEQIGVSEAPYERQLKARK